MARRVHCLPDWMWRRTSSASMECLTYRIAAPLSPDERSSVSWSMVKLDGASSSASQPVMAEAGDWATYRFSSGNGSMHLASSPITSSALAEAAASITSQWFCGSIQTRVSRYTLKARGSSSSVTRS